MVAASQEFPLAAGEGVVAVAHEGGRSVVARAIARPPLALLLPRNHGVAPWIFTSNLGGGLVDGDRIALRMSVAPRAAALLTTQASGKVYRSPGGCQQSLDAEVGAEASLLLLPDAMVCFAGARLRQRARIQLGPGASLLWLDALTAGRVACGERWQFDSYRSVVEVEREGSAVLRDAVELDPAHGDLAQRLGRFTALATVVAVGARAPLAPPRAPVRGGDVHVAATWFDAGDSGGAGGEGTLVRVAATSTQRLNIVLRELLAPLVATLGDDPFARKW